MNYKEERMSNEDIKTLIKQYQSVNKSYRKTTIEQSIIVLFLLFITFLSTRLFIEISGIMLFPKILPTYYFITISFTTIIMASWLPYRMYSFAQLLKKDLQ
jgi:hypothetical protein